jgi:16S rRNA (uracil1498-N3)-methyltransferase
MGHRVYFEDLSHESTGVITITGDEAHHALRAKRLEVGESVELLNGEGLVGHTRIQSTSKTREGWSMVLALERLEEVPPVQPCVCIASATPKGERLEEMVDGLSQVGAYTWRPITTKRGVVVDPGHEKLQRLERVAIESMKQCGRAWRLFFPMIHPYKEVLNSTGRVIVADASGEPYQPTGADWVTVVVGPEGGWDPSEIDFARNRGLGIKFVRFGPYTMRTEVAAVVAAAHVLAAEQAFRAKAI